MVPSWLLDSMPFIQILCDCQAEALTLELAFKSLRMSWVMRAPHPHCLVQKTSDGAQDFNFKGTSSNDDKINQRPSFCLKFPCPKGRLFPTNHIFCPLIISTVASFWRPGITFINYVSRAVMSGRSTIWATRVKFIHSFTHLLTYLLIIWISYCFEKSKKWSHVAQAVLKIAM